MGRGGARGAAVALTAAELRDLALREAPIAVLDLEMTGLDPTKDRVCEIAIVRMNGAELHAELHSLVRPGKKLSAGAKRVTGLNEADLVGAPPFSDIADAVAGLLDGAIVLSHNVAHDLAFLHREFDAAEILWPPPTTADTLLMARRLFAFPKNDLKSVAAEFGLPAPAHRALADAHTTLSVWRRMLDVLDPDGMLTFGEFDDLVSALAPNSPQRLVQQRVLKDALRSQRSVFIAYASTEPGAVVAPPTRREIAIWRLKVPYIQAWCYLRGGERIFRLDRIRTVEEGVRVYEIPPHDPRI